MPWTLKISSKARQDLDHFRAYDLKAYADCRRLTSSTAENPFEGAGRPMKAYGFDGEVWFRRVSLTDRMVYEVFEDTVLVASYRTHLE